MNDLRLVHQQLYRDLKKELGRDPTLQELDEKYQELVIAMMDFYRDFKKMNQGIS